MDRLVHLDPRAQRGDDHRNFVLHTKLEILLEPVVRLVDDLVHRKRRRKHVRMRPVPGGQLFGDLVKPLVKQGHRPRIQRRERAHDPRLALRDDKLRAGNDEQRRSDHRQAQSITQNGR